MSREAVPEGLNVVAHTAVEEFALQEARRYRRALVQAERLLDAPGVSPAARCMGVLAVVRDALEAGDGAAV